MVHGVRDRKSLKDEDTPFIVVLLGSAANGRRVEKVESRAKHYNIVTARRAGKMGGVAEEDNKNILK